VKKLTIASIFELKLCNIKSMTWIWET